MDEKTGAGQVDDQEAREREASELQAQIDEIISGKGDTEVERPKTLRDLTRPGPEHSFPTPARESEESGPDD